MSESRFRRGLVQPLLLSAVVALLLASAACGGTGETQAKPSDPQATSVEVNQTGGFAGVDQLYTVDDKVDNQRRGSLFDMVGSPDFQTLTDAYTGPNDCRDSYFYTVTVTYRDGTSKRVTTDECNESPKLLTDVIALTKEIGQRKDGK
ncbi:protealysin inhibitor emfourin [Nocardia sp. NPDC050175]|uniref:protealysin inhibitor emfourin n=1 Tax=Nocardia sp. NPDC050175 TaxID=3364317 RepID=UPI0037B3F605